MLSEQQTSEEALAIKRECDSLVDFCGYLTASQQCDGMFIGNAEVIPFSPRRNLYHACMAYMRANGLSKPISLTRLGTVCPEPWLSMVKRIFARKVPRVITENHIALWNLIRSRTMNNDICTRAVIRDDMKAPGLDVKTSVAG
ncbi:primase-like DNA-binding domain-containing protein [Pantoea sp. FN0307]|uniref:primase-like DNA-binding domain-containing protein n=1 Tax=Pantoea sp. FN0307 TaxID=3418560 RepID=UPI003CF71B48